MILSPEYEIVAIADEFLAVPIGEMASKSKDVFSFSKAASFLLNMLKEQKSQKELVNALVENFNVDEQTASSDVERFISSLSEYGLIR